MHGAIATQDFLREFRMGVGCWVSWWKCELVDW